MIDRWALSFPRRTTRRPDRIAFVEDFSIEMCKVLGFPGSTFLPTAIPLLLRVSYGGRKGRAAERRLDRLVKESVR